MPSSLVEPPSSHRRTREELQARFEEETRGLDIAKKRLRDIAEEKATLERRRTALEEEERQILKEREGHRSRRASIFTNVCQEDEHAVDGE